jgi:uncharacterized membrane protein SpoIIM required for sporulation
VNVVALAFWKRSSSRMKRFLTIVAFFVLLVVAMIVGMLTPLSASATESNNNELQTTIDSFKGRSVWQNTLAIFENNYVITLRIFIPFIGPSLYGLYDMYYSGLVSGSYGNVHHFSAVLNFLLEFILPFTWLELGAYATAMASSVWLTWRLIQGRGKQELIRTGIFIAICAVMIFLGALIEAYLLSLVPSA